MKIWGASFIAAAVSVPSAIPPRHYVALSRPGGKRVTGFSVVCRLPANLVPLPGEGGPCFPKPCLPHLWGRGTTSVVEGGRCLAAGWIRFHLPEKILCAGCKKRGLMQYKCMKGQEIHQRTGWDMAASTVSLLFLHGGYDYEETGTHFYNGIR